MILLSTQHPNAILGEVKVQGHGAPGSNLGVRCFSMNIDARSAGPPSSLRFSFPPPET